MSFRSVATLLGVLALIAWSYLSMSWMGLALVFTTGVMWALLHYTRLIHVFKRAAQRPMGYVESAVMLNAKLVLKMPLIKVIAITKSLGLAEQLDTNSGMGAKVKEVFVWVDNSGDRVRCEFLGGRLDQWQLHRVPQAEEQVHALGS